MDDRELFERHAKQVLQFFVNKVHAPSDASDLAQETFVRCFQRLRRGDVHDPRAFLFGVANFVLREYWTAKARHRRERGGDDGFDPGRCSVVEMGATKSSVTSVMARHEGQQRMLDAMRCLRLDHQNVLELRYWHELRYSEIAEILGESQKTVTTRLRRAKEDLRRRLAAPADRSDSAEEPFTPHTLERWLRASGEAPTHPSAAPDGEPSAA